MTENKYWALVSLLLRNMCFAYRNVQEKTLKNYEQLLEIDDTEQIFAFLKLNEPELYYSELDKLIEYRKRTEKVLEERSKQNGISGVSDR